MNKEKNMPIGISLFLVFLFILEVSYFFVINFTTGIFAYHGYTIDAISSIPVSYTHLTLPTKRIV